MSFAYFVMLVTKAIMATIYLIRFNREEGELVTTESVVAKYPHIVHDIEHGDILENLAESGYRSRGVYFWFQPPDADKGRH